MKHDWIERLLLALMTILLFLAMVGIVAIAWWIAELWG